MQFLHIHGKVWYLIADFNINKDGLLVEVYLQKVQNSGYNAEVCFFV